MLRLSWTPQDASCRWLQRVTRLMEAQSKVNAYLEVDTLKGSEQIAPVSWSLLIGTFMHTRIQPILNSTGGSELRC